MIIEVVVGIVLLIIAYAIIAAICVGIGALSLAMATGAVVFSRAVFSLLIAIGLSATYPFFADNDILNCVSWMVIIFGVVMLLSLLPRVNNALKFFCTVFISYIAVEILGVMLIGLIYALMGRSFEITLPHEIAIKVISTAVSVVALVKEIKKGPGKFSLRSTNIVLVNIQRVLASVIYGVAAIIIFALSTNNLWEFSAVVNWSIFGGTAVVTFLADVFLMEHLVGKV